jgi:hypothetical protein
MPAGVTATHHTPFGVFVLSWLIAWRTTAFMVFSREFGGVNNSWRPVTITLIMNLSLAGR